MSGLLVYLRDFSLTVWSPRCLKCEVRSRRMRRCEIKTVVSRLTTSSDWWYVCVITRISLQKPGSLQKKYSDMMNCSVLSTMPYLNLKWLLKWNHMIQQLYLQPLHSSATQKLMLQQQTVCFTKMLCYHNNDLLSACNICFGDGPEEFFQTA